GCDGGAPWAAAAYVGCWYCGYCGCSGSPCWGCHSLMRHTLRSGGVVRVAVRPAIFLHLRLVQVWATFDQHLASLALQVAEQGPVAVVVVLHDLEGPAVRDHVAADQVGGDPVREAGVSGRAQRVDGL